MQALENNALFTEVSAEQSEVVSGGGRRKYKKNDFHFDLDSYLFVIGAGQIFGNPGLTPDEVQVAWELAISL